MAVGAYVSAFATSTYGSIFNLSKQRMAVKPLGVMVYFVSLGVVLVIAGLVIGGIFAAMRQSRRIHSSLPGVLMLLFVAWFVADIAESSRAVHRWPLVWAPTIELLQRMFNGMIAQGHAWMAHLQPLPLGVAKPLTLLVALIGGGCAAAGAGLIVGLPTLRLRGDYLAIATLGFAEIIRIAIVNSQPLGGATGLTGIPVYQVHADPDSGARAFYMFPWIYGCALLTSIVIWRIARSAKGRALEAVREDEIAAAAIGIDTTHHKVLAFMIGAFFAGVAGALYAHYHGYLNPNLFGIMRSIEIVVMVTLGGLGSIPGAIIAAIILTILPEALRPIAEWRMVIYSLLLIGMMLARGTGFGRRQWTWTTDRLRGLWPYSKLTS
jgi:branched-chain amino acid transport system permease protein